MVVIGQGINLTESEKAYISQLEKEGNQAIKVSKVSGNSKELNLLILPSGRFVGEEQTIKLRSNNPQEIGQVTSGFFGDREALPNDLEYKKNLADLERKRMIEKGAITPAANSQQNQSFDYVPPYVALGQKILAEKEEQRQANLWKQRGDIREFPKPRDTGMVDIRIAEQSLAYQPTGTTRQDYDFSFTPYTSGMRFITSSDYTASYGQQLINYGKQQTQKGTFTGSLIGTVVIPASFVYGAGETIYQTFRHPIQSVKGMSQLFLNPKLSLLQLKTEFKANPFYIAGQFYGGALAGKFIGRIGTTFYKNMPKLFTEPTISGELVKTIKSDKPSLSSVYRIEQAEKFQNSFSNFKRDIELKRIREGLPDLTPEQIKTARNKFFDTEQYIKLKEKSTDYFINKDKPRTNDFINTEQVLLERKAKIKETIKRLEPKEITFLKEKTKLGIENIKESIKAKRQEVLKLSDVKTKSNKPSLSSVYRLEQAEQFNIRFEKFKRNVELKRIREGLPDLTAEQIKTARNKFFDTEQYIKIKEKPSQVIEDKDLLKSFKLQKEDLFKQAKEIKESPKEKLLFKTEGLEVYKKVEPKKQAKPKEITIYREVKTGSGEVQLEAVKQKSLTKSKLIQEVKQETLIKEKKLTKQKSLTKTKKLQAQAFAIPDLKFSFVDTSKASIKQASILISKQTQKDLVKNNLKLKDIQAQGTAFKDLTAQDFKFNAKQLQGQGLSFKDLTAQGTKQITKTKVPSPRFQININEGKKRPRFSKPKKINFKQRKKYTPSATAILIGIKGKYSKIGEKTGLGIRPILKGAKK